VINQSLFGWFTAAKAAKYLFPLCGAQAPVNAGVAADGLNTIYVPV